MVAITNPVSTIQVISMYRYAIKGLSGDPILASQSPLYLKKGETFPDDRRFALLKVKEDTTETSPFNPNDPKWLHKENFLCAFSAPALMATFDTEYRIVEGENDEVTRELTIWKRNHKQPRSELLLGPMNLCSRSDRRSVSSFFSSACGEPVKLVSSKSNTIKEKNDEHTHQFGNTRSGVKARKDTRTIHIVNAATVRQVSEKIGIPLSPRRFRPNIVVDGWEPWEEFDVVGKSIQCCYSNEDENGLILDVISKTVRCKGISLDPYDEDVHQLPLDIPNLLQEHFPEHGPYLGVYAVVRESGSLFEGSFLKVISCD